MTLLIHVPPVRQFEPPSTVEDQVDAGEVPWVLLLGAPLGNDQPEAYPSCSLDRLVKKNQRGAETVGGFEAALSPFPPGAGRAGWGGGVGVAVSWTGRVLVRRGPGCPSGPRGWCGVTRRPCRVRVGRRGMGRHGPCPSDPSWARVCRPVAPLVRPEPKISVTLVLLAATATRISLSVSTDHGVRHLEA